MSVVGFGYWVVVFLIFGLWDGIYFGIYGLLVNYFCFKYKLMMYINFYKI